MNLARQGYTRPARSLLLTVVLFCGVSPYCQVFASTLGSRVVSWPEDVTNPLLNPDFEVGLYGWGSWYGGRVLASEETGSAPSGLQCARLVSSPTETPLIYDDVRATVRPAPVTLVSLGLIPLATDQAYTISAWLKANRAGVRASLGLGSIPRHVHTKVVDVSTQWRREAVALSPCQPYGFVFIQLVPGRSRDEEIELWVDGVQLERGWQAHPFQRRFTVELGAECTPDDGIAVQEEPLRVRIRTVNYGSAAWKGNLSMKVTNFFDRTVLREDRSLTLGPEGRREELVEIPGSLGTGFFRFWYGLGGSFDPLHTLRLARIRPYKGETYRFGLNHVYTYPRWQKRALEAGIGWGRNWSYSWPNVEPRQGVWNFDGADQILAYTKRTGMEFLALLSRSSCNWSSTAPPDAPHYLPPIYSTARLGYLPASIRHWQTYVQETGRRLRGQVQAFEILGGPPGEKSTPRPGGGYDMDDYVRLLEAAYRALGRVATGSKIVAGLPVSPRDHPGLLDDFLASEAIENLDILSIQDYPPDVDARINEPFLAQLASRLRERKKRALPIWITQFAFWADDDNDFDLFPEPAADSRAASHAVKSERRAADLAVQYNILAAAYGVEKVFYDVQGGRAGIPNCDAGDEIFFEWNGAPRKMYPAQATLADLLRPDSTFVTRLDIGPDGVLPFYIFRSPQGAVAFTWSNGTESMIMEAASNVNFTLRNVVGGLVANATLSIHESPVSVAAVRDASALSAWLVEVVSPTVHVQRGK